MLDTIARISLATDRDPHARAIRTYHPKHRSDYAVQARTRPMGAGLDLYARRRDKTEFPVDIMLSPLTLEGQSFTWLSSAISQNALRRNRSATGRHRLYAARRRF